MIPKSNNETNARIGTAKAIAIAISSGSMVIAMTTVGYLIGTHYGGEIGGGVGVTLGGFLAVVVLFMDLYRFFGHHERKKHNDESEEGLK